MLPLLQNIFDQPASLQAVVDHQFGPGYAALARSADILRQAEQVVISGMGASLFSTIPFTYSLAQEGMSVPAIETSELLYFLQRSLRAKTAVILVSRSGESIETLKLLPQLKALSCPTIGISNVPESTLAREADESIILHSQADELVAVQTYTGTLMVLALLAAVHSEHEQLARAEADAAIRGAHEILERSRDSSVLDRFVGGGDPLYVLGRGAAIGSVQEAVLLMHEVAKSPAIGMSSAQFRHGPVEVLYRKIKAIVFGTAAETLELDRALASDIAGLGAQVGWIGHGAASSTVTELCYWPDEISQRFAPILEILPIQLLSVKMAQANGIRPGEFRFAPAVTASETGFLSQGKGQ